MDAAADPLFRPEVWTPALETYGAVAHLTVAVFGRNGRVVCGPTPATPLASLFRNFGYEPGVMAECAQRCLAQDGSRGAVVVKSPYGLAVVGTSLVLNGDVMGAAVAGYALVEFTQTTAIRRLAREAQIPFEHVWDLARSQPPVPERRLILQGELLQVLGNSLLRADFRARQYEATAADLSASNSAKDEFLAVLSHELRTPLAPILGWARLLTVNPDPDWVERAAKVIERNALLQTRLVDDLLELNRWIRGKALLELKVISLGAAVGLAVEAIAEAAEKKGIAVCTLDIHEPLNVRADGDRLQQVFRNVLLNALKFTPPGGRVTVSVVREGNRGVVRIRDTGEGITEEFQPFVFEMFRQQELGTRRGHGGLGIGLALVKNLVEAHGGRVTVGSEGAGRGTLVTIQLPLVTDALVRRPVHSTPARELDGLSILLVEDSEDSLEPTQLMLEQLGSKVVTARDGVEALETIASIPVDLVLCDLRMPRMDGFQFLNELHRMRGGAHPPVIAISSHASAEDHRRSEMAGFTGHVDKPLDEVHILAAVGAAISAR